jgi:hypothetical protein
MSHTGILEQSALRAHHSPTLNDVNDIYIETHSCSSASTASDRGYVALFRESLLFQETNSLRPQQSSEATGPRRKSVGVNGRVWLRQTLTR